nr:hypothetical protein [Macrococcus goetzii]
MTPTQIGSNNLLTNNVSSSAGDGEFSILALIVFMFLIYLIYKIYKTYK